MQAHSTRAFQTEGAVASLQWASPKTPKYLAPSYIGATWAQISFTPVHPSKGARRTSSTTYEQINHYVMFTTSHISCCKIMMDDY